MSPLNQLDAYYRNIEMKTGKSKSDFRKLAEKRGYIKRGSLTPDVKAAEVMKWLKEEYDLGRGHALAIYHSLTQAE